MRRYGQTSCLWSKQEDEQQEILPHSTIARNKFKPHQNFHCMHNKTSKKKNENQTNREKTFSYKWMYILHIELRIN